jgi:hypothetical protein
MLGLANLRRFHDSRGTPPPPQQKQREAKDDSLSTSLKLRGVLRN